MLDQVGTQNKKAMAEILDQVKENVSQIRSSVIDYKDATAYSEGKKSIFRETKTYFSPTPINSNIWDWFYTQLKAEYNSTADA